jgi:hypothetical protein
MPPPTRAKSAMVEAPIEKPVSTLMASGRGNIFEKTMKRTAMPMSARPTTVMPMTEPPLKATFSACGSPRRAAAVVRTFA